MEDHFYERNTSIAYQQINQRPPGRVFGRNMTLERKKRRNRNPLKINCLTLHKTKTFKITTCTFRIAFILRVIFQISAKRGISIYNVHQILPGCVWGGGGGRGRELATECGKAANQPVSPRKVNFIIGFHWERLIIYSQIYMRNHCLLYSHFSNVQGKGIIRHRICHRFRFFNFQRLVPFVLS